MNTDRTSPLKPVNAVQPREASNASTQKVQKEKTAATTSTSIMLSDAQAKPMQPGTNDVSMGRVETLRITIRNDELRTDTGKIADSLIHEAQNYPQGK